MSLTRKDTKALLTILWESCTDAYIQGYNHGLEGKETAQSPYPKPSIETLDAIAAKDLDAVAKQIAELTKHFK